MTLVLRLLGRNTLSPRMNTIDNLLLSWILVSRFFRQCSLRIRTDTRLEPMRHQRISRERERISATAKLDRYLIALTACDVEKGQGIETPMSIFHASYCYGCDSQFLIRINIRNVPITEWSVLDQDSKGLFILRARMGSRGMNAEQGINCRLSKCCRKTSIRCAKFRLLGNRYFRKIGRAIRGV